MHGSWSTLSANHTRNVESLNSAWNMRSLVKTLFIIVSAFVSLRRFLILMTCLPNVYSLLLIPFFPDSLFLLSLSQTFLHFFFLLSTQGFRSIVYRFMFEVQSRSLFIVLDSLMQFLSVGTRIVHILILLVPFRLSIHVLIGSPAGCRIGSWLRFLLGATGQSLRNFSRNIANGFLIRISWIFRHVF